MLGGSPEGQGRSPSTLARFRRRQFRLCALLGRLLLCLCSPHVTICTQLKCINF